MSSDLLEGIDDSTVTTTASLTMNVHGYAFFILTQLNDDSITFSLSPDNYGIYNAKRIISALESWVKHVQPSDEK